MFIYLIYVDATFYDCFMTFVMYILDFFYSPNGPSVNIDPGNAVVNFDFILYGHCK